MSQALCSQHLHRMLQPLLLQLLQYHKSWVTGMLVIELQSLPLILYRVQTLPHPAAVPGASVPLAVRASDHQ